MTTVLDDGGAIVVRCDGCRRLWPLTPAGVAAWAADAGDDDDRHLCPACAVARQTDSTLRSLLAD
jgi:hypothetical protein